MVLCLLLTSYNSFACLTTGIASIEANCKTSRDKIIIFLYVLPDLPCELTFDFWAFPIHCSVARSCRPCIRFLCVRTLDLLMASFRFLLTVDTLANRYYFLSTRRKQGLTPCKIITMPDIQKRPLSLGKRPFILFYKLLFT